MPVTMAELSPLLFSRRISWIEYPEFAEFFAYSSTVWLVPSGELSSTTIISVCSSRVSAARNESSIFMIFFDSLYVGITIERERILVNISFDIEVKSLSIISGYRSIIKIAYLEKQVLMAST